MSNRDPWEGLRVVELGQLLAGLCRHGPRLFWCGSHQGRAANGRR